MTGEYSDEEQQAVASLARGFDVVCEDARMLVRCKRCAKCWQLTRTATKKVHGGNVLALLEHEAEHDATPTARKGSKRGR